MIALMFSVVAFSVDSMLPALPQIAQDLGLSNPQFASYILMVFLIGLGVGTLVAGPVADAYGRRPVLFAGFAIYIIGAVLSAIAPTLELMLVARVLQGFGAAGPRVAILAILRDRFAGAEMARIMSFSFIVFLTVPAIAPAIGALVSETWGWRVLFVLFVAVAVILAIWFGTRQPETLAEPDRRPIRPVLLREALSDMFSHPAVRISIYAQTLVMGILFSLIVMVQPIFEITFDRGESFPYWFGGIAIASTFASILNARFVRTFGMRQLIGIAVYGFIALTVLSLSVILFVPALSFAVFILWQLGVFFHCGLTVTNLNAIAAEPMGHIAGLTASVLGATSTVGGALIGLCAALLFDGTAVPLVAFTLLQTTIIAALMATMARAELADAAGESV